MYVWYFTLYVDVYMYMLYLHVQDTYTFTYIILKYSAMAKIILCGVVTSSRSVQSQKLLDY